MFPFPELKSKRLWLRQVHDSDLESVFKGLSHPDVIRYYGVSYESLESTKAQMAWFRELEQNGTGVWWAVCSAENQKFHGAAGINNLDRIHHKAEVGFWLLPEYRRNGIISEAMKEILNYAFHELKLHRIEATVETENEASRNLLLKAGFSYEGTLRDCELKNDRYINLELFALLRTDYGGGAKD